MGWGRAARQAQLTVVDRPLSGIRFRPPAARIAGGIGFTPGPSRPVQETNALNRLSTSGAAKSAATAQRTGQEKAA